MSDDTPSASPSKVAIVVCTRDRPELLQQNVASIARYRRAHDDVVIVDSASRDRSAVPRIAAAAGFRSVRLDLPGASRARNAGVAATTAPLIAFTDDDCLITDGWTTGLEEALSDPAIGFVTGRLIADEESSAATAFAATWPCCNSTIFSENYGYAFCRPE